LGVAVLCILLLGYWLVQFYYKLELIITDPCLEGMLYMAFSYFTIKYLQAPPASTPWCFVMSCNNMFVISLQGDNEHLEKFWQLNLGLEFQVFPATHMIVTNDSNQNHKTNLSMAFSLHNTSHTPYRQVIWMTYSKQTKI
jgi:hypothetical protein